MEKLNTKGDLKFGIPIRAAAWHTKMKDRRITREEA
jgi:hypothetical protein